MPQRLTYLPSPVKNNLQFLLESQYWSLKELQEYQWKKFEKLWEHAYLTVPYYKNLIKDHGISPATIQSFDDLKKIPVLQKAHIRNDLNELVSENNNRRKLTLNSTGGSTGVPLKIYQDQNYTDWATAARIRSWKYFPGFNENETEAVLWGDIRTIGKSLSLKDIVKFIIKPDIAVNTFDLDEKTIKRFLFFYNLVKPRLVRGYASSLFFISDYIEKNNIHIHHPHSIVSSAETLSSNMREKIAKVFQSHVFDSYGCREVSQIAMQCANQDGLHLVMENQFLELEKDESGFNKILVTNLNNLCMPLIRYEVGDFGEGITIEKCGCGRGLVRLQKVLGRTNENILLRNGKVINGEYFEFLFYEIQVVERYQVYYSRYQDKMTIKLKSIDESKETIRFLKETIKNHFDFNNLDVVYTTDFEITSSGKFKFVWMEA